MQQIFVATVDGVHFQIFEPRIAPSSGWHSKKCNEAGLAHKVVVAFFCNGIVWTNGPFPAGQNDLVIFRKEGRLKSKLIECQILVGDEGHCGKSDCVATENKFDLHKLKSSKEEQRLNKKPSTKGSKDSIQNFK